MKSVKTYFYENVFAVCSTSYILFVLFFNVFVIIFAILYFLCTIVWAGVGAGVSGVILHLVGDKAVWYTKNLFVENMLVGGMNTVILIVFTRSRRKRMMASLTSMIAQPHVRLAASVTALLGGRTVKSALALASEKFYTITFENMCKADFHSNWKKYDDTFSKSMKARLGKHLPHKHSPSLILFGLCVYICCVDSFLFVGSCDAFVSHSWSDDGSKKFDALCSWALDFKSENGREPQLWIDKDCIEKTNLSEDLACLPFFLSGCKKFIIMAGPTYTERLWYMSKIQNFTTMQRLPMYIVTSCCCI